jgi:hypothetical protein
MRCDAYAQRAQGKREAPFCVGITALRTMGTATQDWLLSASGWSD